MKESRWCLEEIRHFKALHNGSTEKIIPFIISGNPDEVFPDEILTTAVFNTETGEWEQRAVEPLAANIAADSPAEANRRFKTEFYRVAAPMLATGFDSLYHRERKRRRRKRRAVAASVAAAVLLFSIYSTGMLMKISSQNKDLEQKNSALTAKTNELNESNTSLNRANRELDRANADLVSANSELDNSNLKLKTANSDLDNANSRLLAANEELDNTNSKLSKTNTELDNTNAKLTAANTELDETNTRLITTNTELDKSNADLAKSNAELDKSNAELDQSNKDLAAKTEEALDNLDEANRQKKIAEDNRDEADRQRALAEENLAEAERQRSIAEQNLKYAEEQRDLAEQNLKYAEEQRDLAETNLRLYQQKNAELMESNAELTAANADAMFSDSYDRIGAIDTLFSTPLYQENPYSLKPSARLFLNDALYSYSSEETPRLQYTFDAQSYISDFCFSPGLQYIAAFDTLNRVYVFDAATGDVVFQRDYNYVCKIGFTGGNQLCVADSSGVYVLSVPKGTVLWSKAIDEIGSGACSTLQNAAFSADGKRLAVWDNDGYFAFLNTENGTVYHTVKNIDSMKGYIGGNTNDFSDGVHLYAAAYEGDTEWFVAIDSNANTFKSRREGVDEILAVHHAGDTGSVVVKYVQKPANHYFSQTVLDINKPNGNLNKTVPLYGGLLRDADVKTVFTTGEGDAFAVISGIQSYDEQPALYLVNLSSGEITRYTTPALVSQAGFDDTGYLSVVTVQGAAYNYRLSDGFCILVNVLSDSEDKHADGSQKLVYASEHIAAALGKNSSRIMVYLSDYGDGSTVISNPDNRFTQLAETEACYVAESKGTLFVYDKQSKALLRSIPADYTISQIKPYGGDKAAVLDREQNTLHILNLSDGTDAPLALGKYSKQQNWNLLTNAGASRMVVANNDVLLILDGYQYESYRLPMPILTNQYYGITALSPDGKTLLAASFEGDADCVFELIQLDTKRIVKLQTTKELTVNINRSRTVFSGDSKQAAIANGNNIWLFDVESGSLTATAYAGSAIHSLLFTPDRLLAMTEDYVLSSYSLTDLSPMQTLRLPSEIIGNDTEAKVMLFNESRGEAVIYNDSFACFVDLETFEIVARTNDTHLQIMGFSTELQELAVQKQFRRFELKFYPHYTVEELADKSLSLISGR